MWISSIKDSNLKVLDFKTTKEPIKVLGHLSCNPWWFINLLVRDVIPVTLVKPVAIPLPGLKNTQ